jgi:hypothetical protein
MVRLQSVAFVLVPVAFLVAPTGLANTRLHIDLAKDAYAFTNFKDKFLQMTLWLDCKEYILDHAKYIHHHLDTSPNASLHVVKPLPSLVPKHHQRMAKHPTHRGVPINDICANYGTTYFIPALSRFIAQYQHLDYSKAEIEALSQLIHVPFSKISVFHHLKKKKKILVMMLTA